MSDNWDGLVVVCYMMWASVCILCDNKRLLERGALLEHEEIRLQTPNRVSVHENDVHDLSVKD